MGYDRLDAAAFWQHEEEDITGELTRSMQDALQDRAAPKWAKNFWAVEETRIPDRMRMGKRRLRIDIEIIKGQQGPRPRFRFEAKRLRDAASRREYLGDDGLGCFLHGRYARDDEIAGMIGYVQEGTVEAHATALERVLLSDPTRYSAQGCDQWMKTELVDKLITYRTEHNRRALLPPIILLHTLLSFADPHAEGQA
jgi:hypothetical protein